MKEEQLKTSLKTYRRSKKKRNKYLLKLVGSVSHVWLTVNAEQMWKATGWKEDETKEAEIKPMKLAKLKDKYCTRPLRASLWRHLLEIRRSVPSHRSGAPDLHTHSDTRTYWSLCVFPWSSSLSTDICKGWSIIICGFGLKFCLILSCNTRILCIHCNDIIHELEKGDGWHSNEVFWLF